jgi:hypothetical protein
VHDVPAGDSLYNRSRQEHDYPTLIQGDLSSRAFCRRVQTRTRARCVIKAATTAGLRHRAGSGAQILGRLRCAQGRNLLALPTFISYFMFPPRCYGELIMRLALAGLSGATFVLAACATAPPAPIVAPAPMPAPMVAPTPMSAPMATTPRAATAPRAAASPQQRQQTTPAPPVQDLDIEGNGDGGGGVGGGWG